MPGDRQDDAPSTTLTSHEGTLRTVTHGTKPEVPSRLGHFRVEACIGRGGLGIVYRAYDERLRRPVALKVLAESSSIAASRLLEEARAAASLTHPCIAAIHDVQEQRGVSFIVMELVEGTTLREEMKRRRLPFGEALRYARDIAAGLARAHDSGIVHRDLKPENVMVTAEGGIKILDFGLAREAPESAPESSDPARTGVSGTPGYMAPEQAGGRRVDARADVFSFGVVFWEMLAGRRPTDKEGWLATTDLLVENIPGVTPELARVVERCLRRSPSSRFADAAELVEALASIEVPRPGGLSGTLRRAPMLSTIAATGALGLVAFAVSVRNDPASPAEGPGEAPTAAMTTAAAPVLAISGSPEPLVTEGMCSDFPVFADDGSLVYTRHTEQGAALHRLDLASSNDTVLTNDGANSLRPAPGPPGNIVYLFQHRAEVGGSEVRQVSLEGGPSSTLVRGGDPVFSPAANALFYLGGEGYAVRRRVVGGPDVVLYEPPSSLIFDSLAVSPHARWLATDRTSTVPRPSTNVCFAPLGPPDAKLDCETAGWMTSRRASFGSRDASLYFARDAAIVRFDLETHATQSVAVSPAPTTLAIAPDGTYAVFGTCRSVYQAVRIEPDGTVTSLPASAQEAGLLNVGPHGELAFSVARGGQFALGVTDARAADVRVLTSTEHTVVEVAFSPDGRRLAFHDATPTTGGIFVVDVAGASKPTRLSMDDEDDLPGWLDSEHVLYMHPEKGLPYGRPYVVAAAGGEAHALPPLPGVLLGAVPARGTLLLAVRSSAGDHFVEATRSGKLHDVVLRGVPPGMHWDVSTAASPSGRYMAWFANGSAWKADLEAGTAGPVTFAWPPGDADAIQPDDEGRVTVAFRRTEGQLYRVRGTFP